MVQEQNKLKLPTYEALLSEAIRSLSIDSGMVTTDAPVGTNILQDKTKTWAVDIHKNRLVKIVRGAGVGQLAVIDSNTNKTLLLRSNWVVALNTTSFYVILDKDIAQALRDVFGGGSDISATNPLQVYDPAVAGPTGIFHEQVDTAVNINAVNTGETDIIYLSAANTRYTIKSLRLKCANPGANTVTIRLYELVNNVLIEVDNFDITNANFTTYHSMMDMFGLPCLTGDELRVTARASAGGPYAITGQISHAKTNV